MIYLAAILITFAGADAPRGDVMAYAHDLFARVDSYYAENSYGAYHIQTDLFGVVTIEPPPADLSADDTRDWIAEKAQEQLPGLEKYAYPNCQAKPCAGHFVYLTPSANIGAGGIGLNTGVWMQSGWNDLSVPTFHHAAHEYGHHLQSWNHDHSLNCSQGGLSGDCKSYNQGDSLSVMGYGDGHVSPVAKINEGWLSPLAVNTKSGGQYVLKPYEQSASVLKVTGGTKRNPSTYLLSYRPEANGLIVHLLDPWGRESYLLAMNPTQGLPHTNTHPALTIGQAWCEPGGALTLRPLAMVADGLLISIETRRCE